MATVPVELLFLVFSYMSMEDLLPLTLCFQSSPFDFSCFVDFSQVLGIRGLNLITKSMVRRKIISDIKQSLSSNLLLLSDLAFLLDSDLYDPTFKAYTGWWLPSKLGLDGYCYSRLLRVEFDFLATEVLGPYPLVSQVHRFVELMNCARPKRCLYNHCHKVLSQGWLSVQGEVSSVIHLRPWNQHEDLFFGLNFFSKIKYLPCTRIGGPMKVVLTDDGIEDELMSLTGGSLEETRESERKVESWGKARDDEFQRSCEFRFNCLEKSIEKILTSLEIQNTPRPLRRRSILPEESASRVGDSKRMVRDSTLPMIEETNPTEFSLLHPGWNPIQFESDLALATGCSGVVDGEIIKLPDPGSGGLVPSITIDPRLNFLIRIHTALFKLLSSGSDYPGKDFLRKFRNLRDENLSFDHPSLDLLEIVLEDTVDWRRYIVKRNLFAIPGFHPGLKLTERVIGNSLKALKGEYKSRWDSLLGDCVLPGMLIEGSLDWSDDRKAVSNERDRTHKVNSRRKTSDERSTHRSKTGWSRLSSL